jgi:hypothetical protein
LVAQSDGIALSSSSKLDDPLGYHCHRGIIAIDQAQLAQRVFERDCEERDRVRLGCYVFALQGGPNRHFKIRQGVAVLPVHHAGTNGRQRGTSRREDALDTVIALRRPEDPEQGARFEIHFEKLRHRVDGAAAIPFEATVTADGQDGIHWSSCDLRPPLLMRAAELFADELTVREVAATLRISKSKAGRLRLRALEEGLTGPDEYPKPKSLQAVVQ